MPPQPLAFFRGEFLPLADAKVGIATHALHYGTAVFEGIRANWNEDDSTLYIFRPREHYERLLRGCQILRMDIPYSVDDLCRLSAELVERSGYHDDLYIRPLAFKSTERVANLKLHELDAELTIMTVPLGAYLDVEAVARCCTSSWRRMEDTMIPTGLKISGLYVNSILAKTEAVLAGFDEAILLNQDGHVAEGSGENIFMVQDGRLFTPPITDNVLPGITRDTIMKMAKSELGIETEERSIRRSELYLADEVFMTGTAAHLTPVGEIDNMKIGSGAWGPIATELRSLYFDVIRGRNAKYLDWCMPVRAKVSA
ncbi:MAG: branched-chain amino acid aminotransferase [Chloroflexi bacterium]|jgi:branched-chain amino acid aminotransferase|nr:MAG: branched-chain amino acid aminotransferase [Chloroflexota bacterium]